MIVLNPIIVLISIIVFLSVLLVSIYTPRHRIVRYERYGRTWFTPQETLLMWIGWRDIMRPISPYSEVSVRFDTYEEAKKFLDSLHDDKPKMTVVE